MPAKQKHKHINPRDASTKPTEGPKVNFLESQASCEPPDTGPYIMIQLDGSEIKALIDTGSAVSLIRESLCESMKLPVGIEPTPQLFTIVNGIKFYTSGIVKTTVEVAGIQVPVSLHQADSLPTHILLGRDFASSAKLVINFNQNSFWVDIGLDEPRIKWPLFGVPSSPPCNHQQDFSSDVCRELEHLLSEFPEVLMDKSSVYAYRIDVGDTTNTGPNIPPVP